MLYLYPFSCITNSLLDTSTVESFPLPTVPARMQGPFGHQAWSWGVPLMKWGQKLPETLNHCLSSSSYHLTKASIRDLSIQTVVKRPPTQPWDFPGGPVGKTLSSQRGSQGLIPGQGTRLHMLQLRPSTAK